MRTCSPIERVTCRPLRWISSASCTPVAEPPTTSTARGSRSSGEQYSIAVIARTVVGTPSAIGGTTAMLHAPLASTTDSHVHLPLSVTTSYEPSVTGDGRTDVTVVW